MVPSVSLCNMCVCARACRLTYEINPNAHPQRAIIVTVRHRVNIDIALSVFTHRPGSKRRFTKIVSVLRQVTQIYMFGYNRPILCTDYYLFIYYSDSYMFRFYKSVYNALRTGALNKAVCACATYSIN
jgi:hypothetical protein